MRRDELWQYYKMVTDVWRFFRIYAAMMGTQDEDKAWTELVEKADVLVDRYQRDPLMKNLVLAFVGELERISRSMRRNK